MRLYSIGIFALLLLFACNKSSKQAAGDTHLPTDALSEYAGKNFGSDYLLTMNTSNEYVLISTTHKIKPSDPLPTLKFEIVQMDSLKPIFNDIVPGGSATWVEEYVVEVISKVGAPPKENEQANPKKYKYHVKNQKKYSGTFLNSK